MSSTISLLCKTSEYIDSVARVFRRSWCAWVSVGTEIQTMSKGLHFQLFHLDLLHLSNLIVPAQRWILNILKKQHVVLPGGLLLLHKDSISLGHSPVARTWHCRAEKPSTWFSGKDELLRFAFSNGISTGSGSYLQASCSPSKLGWSNSSCGNFHPDEDG